MPRGVTISGRPFSIFHTQKKAFKNNLFGYTAYDSDPYNSATTFESYENAINKVAESLSTRYLHVAGTKINDELTATGIYFNGTTAKSVNIRYASSAIMQGAAEVIAYGTAVKFIN